MRVTGVIWLRDVVDKISWKHHVTTDEVEEVFGRSPFYRFIMNKNERRSYAKQKKT